jgi:hypothetical protein
LRQKLAEAELRIFELTQERDEAIRRGETQLAAATAKVAAVRQQLEAKHALQMENMVPSESDATAQSERAEPTSSYRPPLCNPLIWGQLRGLSGTGTARCCAMSRSDDSDDRLATERWCCAVGAAPLAPWLDLPLPASQSPDQAATPRPRPVYWQLIVRGRPETLILGVLAAADGFDGGSSLSALASEPSFFGWSSAGRGFHGVEGAREGAWYESAPIAEGQTLVLRLERGLVSLFSPHSGVQAFCELPSSLPHGELRALVATMDGAGACDGVVDIELLRPSSFLSFEGGKNLSSREAAMQWGLTQGNLVGRGTSICRAVSEPDEWECAIGGAPLDPSGCAQCTSWKAIVRGQPNVLIIGVFGASTIPTGGENGHCAHGDPRCAIIIALV